MEDFRKVFIEAINRIDVDAVNTAINIIKDSIIGGNRVLTFGNGGSLSIAEHFVSDIVKGIGKPLPIADQVICPLSNRVMFSAIANDIGYDKLFVQAIEAMCIAEFDTVITFSVSGTSENVRQLRNRLAEYDISHVFFTSGEFIAFHNEIPVVINTGLPLEDSFGIVEGIFSFLAHHIAAEVRKGCTWTQ